MREAMKSNPNKFRRRLLFIPPAIVSSLFPGQETGHCQETRVAQFGVLSGFFSSKENGLIIHKP